ncbi:hypothetical protein D4764_18G0003010 [Takifugu flavidus]|uniref:Uncharacterized protein n=1 Tax=Takifugu flavidus TaxID=433684 RepID=A0A5C6NRD1_9TELE|nr:hypothetical protein D4764_18G0003010 [Takifugu flavidus]
MLSHKSFHVSKVKPVAESDLVPAPVLWMGGLPTQSGASWTSVTEDESSSSWSTGRGTRSWVPRRFILDNSLLRDFYCAHPDKPGRAPALPSESLGVSPTPPHPSPARLRSPRRPAGLENAQDLTPALGPLWSSLCAPEDWTSASLRSRRIAEESRTGARVEGPDRPVLDIIRKRRLTKEEGGQDDGWLAAQRSMIEEQKNQKSASDDMNRRIVRIENMLVKARDEGGAKARKKGRRKRKDEEESEDEDEEEGTGGGVKACDGLTLNWEPPPQQAAPTHVGKPPTGRGHESIRNSSPSHPGSQGGGAPQYKPWKLQDLSALRLELPSLPNGAAPWIAAFKALTMGVPLALGDVRMVVAACVGLEKLAGVEQLAGTSVRGETEHQTLHHLQTTSALSVMH